MYCGAVVEETMEEIFGYLGQYGTAIVVLVFVGAISIVIPPTIEAIDRLKKRRRARV